MKIFFKNQNNNERITRFIISQFLVPAPIIYGFDYFSTIQLAVGGILIFNAFSGICVIYRLFGINTCKL